jgi:hypothetical protein
MNFYCDICFKSFTTIQAFKSHERSNNHLLKILQKANENPQQIEETTNEEMMDEENDEEMVNEEMVESESNIKENKDLLYFSDEDNSSLEDLMDKNSSQEEVNRNNFFFQIELIRKFNIFFFIKRTFHLKIVK